MTIPTESVPLVVGSVETVSPTRSVLLSSTLKHHSAEHWDADGARG